MPRITFATFPGRTQYPTSHAEIGSRTLLSREYSSCSKRVGYSRSIAASSSNTRILPIAMSPSTANESWGSEKMIIQSPFVITAFFGIVPVFAATART